MTDTAEPSAPAGNENRPKEPVPLSWRHEVAQRILAEWHAEVTGEDNGGARSALRRVGPAEEACLVPAFGDLVRLLKAARFDVLPPRAMRLTAEAVAVAEIDRNTGLARRGDEAKADGDASDPAEAESEEGSERRAAKKAQGSFEERVALSFALALRAGKVSPARARLLLQTDEFAPFMRLLRGMLAMLRAKRQPVSAVAVAEIVRSWRDPDRRALLRRHIALAMADTLSSDDQERPR